METKIVFPVSEYFIVCRALFYITAMQLSNIYTILWSTGYSNFISCRCSHYLHAPFLVQAPKQNLIQFCCNVSLWSLIWLSFSALCFMTLWRVMTSFVDCLNFGLPDVSLWLDSAYEFLAGVLQEWYVLSESSQETCDVHFS